MELSGTTIDDDHVAEDDLVGMVQTVSLGSLALPPGADIVGYHAALPGGDPLFVSDLSMVLTPSGFTVGPGDVVLYNGFAYVLLFDASSVSPGARVDAVSRSGSDLLLSFDTTVEVDGITAADEDLLRFDFASFSLELNGSAAGIAPALDLDGAHLDESSGELLLSFDGSGVVGGVVFDDEDVLAFDPVGGSWQLAYDGSAEHPGWIAADLDALSVAASMPDPSLIFADGFESGSTIVWSGTVP